MVDFASLPKKEKVYVIESLGLSERETRILTLRYVDEFDYQRIAAEMSISSSSVGRTLTRAREHSVDVVKHLYPIADDRLKCIIDALGWRELECPVISNRRKHK